MYGYVCYNVIMAFIRITKNKEGRQHVYLVEGYRENGKVKQRIIHKYGLLDELEAQEPGILERLKREVKENAKIDPDQLTVNYSLKEPMNRPDLKFGWKILDDLFSTLKLHRFFSVSSPDMNLTNVTRLLVFQRILKPNSKLKTYISQAELFGQWDVSYNSVYRSLDRLDELKTKLQQHLHHEMTNLTHRKATLVFYDVTNYYFEVDVPDEDLVDDEGNIIVEGLKKRGASKEHRRDPIVQLGLFMDANGIPISYRLFQGNFSDPNTGEIIPYSPIIEINQKEVDFDAQFDGINVLVTSEIEKEDDEILAAYQELSRIEDCFRVTKTEFDSRPVYVRKPSHIEGHFLICFMALTLMRLLQHAINWKMSPRKIVEALNSMEATSLTQGFYRVQQNQHMDELNQYLGIDWKNGIVRYEDLNQYGKHCIHNTLKRKNTSDKR